MAVRKKKTIEIEKVDIAVSDVPVEEKIDKWETIQNVEIKDTQGIGLESVVFSGKPGTMFRIRSMTRKGRCYDATIWSNLCKGIPKSESLSGHEFGGNEIGNILVQKIGEGSIEMKYKIYGE